jgi:hypothetical protein
LSSFSPVLVVNRRQGNVHREMAARAATSMGAVDRAEARGVRVARAGKGPAARSRRPTRASSMHRLVFRVALRADNIAARSARGARTARSIAARFATIRGSRAAVQEPTTSAARNLIRRSVRPRNAIKAQPANIAGGSATVAAGRSIAAHAPPVRCAERRCPGYVASRPTRAAVALFAIRRAATIAAPLATIAADRSSAQLVPARSPAAARVRRTCAAKIPIQADARRRFAITATRGNGAVSSATAAEAARTAAGARG